MSIQTRKHLFIINAYKTHNFKYFYDTVHYRNMQCDVIITCPIHGKFTQSPKNHLMGSGCPECGYYNRSKVKLNKLPLYKKPRLLAVNIKLYINIKESCI